MALRVNGRRAVLAAAALLTSGAAGCPATRWQSLPPTPALPPPDHDGFVEHDGARLYVAQYGAGPAVLLLHGGLANAAYWGHQIPVLARRMRVLALDTRGHGRSTLGPHPLDFGLLARDVAAVMDHAGTASAALAGWSDGGITALTLASAAPHRVGRLFSFGANMNRGGLIRDGDHAPAFRSYVQRSLAETRALQPGGTDRLQAALRVLWQSPTGLDAARLGAIRAQACIADGEHDEIVQQSEAARIARAIPGAASAILPCTSHFAMLQDPGAFNALLLRAVAAA